MSKPKVFIIESLCFDDENNQRFEGEFLSQILHLGCKKSKYYYIRTKKELKKVLKIYKKSNYRYLHISCHGNATSIWTTLDGIKFPEFAELLRPYLKKKRLFISACSAVNDNLAKLVIPPSGCYSLVGPNKEIGFNDAAIVWASFYHLIFTENTKKMKRVDILSILKKVKNTFGASLNYFAISASSSKGYKKINI